MYEEQTSSFKTAISFIKWFSIYITNLAKIKARKAGTIPRDIIFYSSKLRSISLTKAIKNIFISDMRESRK